MTVREYIGARYVPLFMGEWDITNSYEPLSIVQYQGNSYTSRQAVPSNIQITDEIYWAQTGNYNAQVEAYRQEVYTFSNRISNNEQAISDETTNRENADDALENLIGNEATSRENADDALETLINTSIENEENAREEADNTLENNINAIDNLINSNGWIENEMLKDESISFNKLEDEIYDSIVKGSIVDSIEPYYIGDIIAYNGKFYGSANNIPCIAQGGCFNGSEYVYALINDNSTSTKIAISNELTNTWGILNVTISNAGHSNCMAFDGNRYYIYTDYETGTIIVLDANFLYVKTIQSPTNMYGCIGYDKKTHLMWFVTYQGEIFQFDNTNDTFTRMDYTLSETVTTSDIIGNNGQGFAVYDNVFVFPVGGVPRTGLRVYNALNGKHIKDISIPYHTAIYPFTEPEDCDFDDDGTLYIHTIASNATDNSTRYAWGAFLWKTNIFKGSLTQVIQGSANYTGGELYLEHSSNYNGFKSTGWENSYPFKDMLEANLVLNNPTMNYKRLNVCVNTPYSNSTAQVLNGSMYLEGANTTIVSHSSGNKVWNGVLSLRGRCDISLVNKFTISGARDMPFNYLVRVTESKLTGSGIEGQSGSLSNVNPLRAESDCMIYIPFSRLDGSDVTPATNLIKGFGYVLGLPHQGN